MIKQIKTKEERLKEGIALLKQLKEAGVQDHSLSYIDLKQKITDWVSNESSWEGNIDFSEYGRVAEVTLPKYNNKSASINLKIKKRY